MAFLLTQLKDLYIGIRGFHTDRKLVVFESDDWGSIRMPSKAVLDELKSLGDTPGKDPFLSYDCLESESDLLALYEVLGSVTDSKGHTPIFTLNFAMANPDFDAIDYQRGRYAYEPFYETYRKYYGENRILELLKDGYQKKLILPQLHCREHMNVGRWMHDLARGKKDTRMAFDHRMIGVGTSFHENNEFGYMDAFNTDFSSDETLSEILRDAIGLFRDTFGFDSATFVASCHVWNEHLERTLHENGISYIQSAPWQNKPIGTNGSYRLKRTLRYTGQTNKTGQRYSVRNCYFEPAYDRNTESWVESCLKEIAKAFRYGKPAIVSTHRLNYIASIDPENRKNNLLGLKALLDAIVERYPDVEFVSSAEVFAMMAEEKR